jgi:hypothetical protein
MSKTSMTAIALGAFGAALLASAAPLNATTIGSAEVSNVDQIGLVCNEYYGRCWRTRGPRYVLRYYYDPSYFPVRGYNYYAGPGYYDRGYGYGYGYGGPRFTIRGLVARSASRCCEAQQNRWERVEPTPIGLATSKNGETAPLALLDQQQPTRRPRA